MNRILTSLVLGVCLSACGSSDSPPSPTAPAQTSTTPATATRVIGLNGNLAFGDVAAGSTATSALTITNTGNTHLTVTGMSAPSGGAGIYKSSWVSGSIPAGGTQAVTITFAPAAAIPYSGNLSVTADQTSGTNSIPISGAGASSSRVSLTGVVISSTGDRITGATLKVLDGANAGRTATSTDGNYRFENLAVGNANLSANGSGFSQTIKGLFINGAVALDFALVRAPTPATQPSPSPTPTPKPTPAPSGTRVGAICNDGWHSSATGSGACSSHGGVRCWKYSDGSCRAK